jgi:gas vesicle protein
MAWWGGLLIGLFMGTHLGIFVAGLLAAAKRGSEPIEPPQGGVDENLHHNAGAGG